MFVVKKISLFILCLLPLLWLLAQGIYGGLGPDPGKEIVLFTGIWSLRFLLLTLAISPLRTIFAVGEAIRYRRMLGLYVWFYASLHFAAVWTYLLGWSWAIFIEEFSERPYMMVGILAWILLLPLGLTSNRWSQRLLGYKWRRLHQLVYLIAVLACIHFLWLVRSDYAESVFYCALLAVLLLCRVKWFRMGARQLVNKRAG